MYSENTFNALNNLSTIFTGAKVLKSVKFSLKNSRGIFPLTLLDFYFQTENFYRYTRVVRSYERPDVLEKASGISTY